ncbi:MAG: hypothetical protein JRE10_11390 [Deltaproteobacteria bacterium]|nr:hypothetical protein [Deltaproteobacteria bacterium]
MHSPQTWSSPCLLLNTMPHLEHWGDSTGKNPEVQVGHKNGAIHFPKTLGILSE